MLQWNFRKLFLEKKHQSYFYGSEGLQGSVNKTKGQAKSLPDDD